jgi:hypothetical protein
MKSRMKSSSLKVEIHSLQSTQYEVSTFSSSSDFRLRHNSNSIRFDSSQCCLAVLSISSSNSCDKIIRGVRLEKSLTVHSKKGRTHNPIQI